MTNSILPASLSVLFFASVTILPMARYFYIRPLDEGFYAYPAYLIYKGEHPYRDFYLGYTPGKTYLMASLFRLFGPSLITARYYYAVVSILLSFEIVWLTYLIVPSVLLAWLSGVLFILSLFPRRELYYITAVETGMFSDRTAIAVLVMITAIIANNSQSHSLFFLSGLLLTLTLFFAQEAGIWVSAAVVLYFLTDHPESWAAYGISFIFGAVSFGVLISLFAVKAGVPFRRFFNECFKEILILGTGSCRRPYPSLFSALPGRLTFGGIGDFKKNRLHFFIHYCRYYMPLFFFVAALFIFIGAVAGGSASMERGVILPLVYGGFASYFIYSWPDYSHVVRGLPVHIPIALFTLSHMYGRLTARGNQPLTAEDFFLTYLLTLFGVILLYDIFYGVRTWVSEIKEKKEKILLRKNAGIYMDRRYFEKVSSLIKKMGEEAGKDEKIFTVPADPLVCFLMQKRTKVYLKSFLPFNPSHYHSQAVSVLKNDAVKWIIYNREQDREDFFPKGSTFSGYAPVLYEYIQREYSKAFELKGYDVYKKN